MPHIIGASQGYDIMSSRFNERDNRYCIIKNLYIAI